MAHEPAADDEEETMYVVTAYVEEDPEPRSYTVQAADAEAANEKVKEAEGVRSVLHEQTKPFTGLYRVSVQGTPSEVTEAIEAIEATAETVAADVSVDDVTATVWPAGEDMDDEQAIRCTVSDWGDLQLRIIGTDLRDGDGRVLEANAASMQAHEDSVVEVVAGDKTLVRAMHDEGADVTPLDTRED